MESSSPELKRILFLDILRSIAIILVIINHLCAGIVRQAQIDSSWWTANVFMSLSKPAVPLFIMISGVLLLANNNKTITQFLLGRLLKVVVPFAAWVLIYFFFFLEVKGDIFHLTDFIYEVVKGHSTRHLPVHLWFLPLIISLYLVTPVIKKFIENSSEKEMYFFLLMNIIFGSLLPSFRNLTDFHLTYNGFIFSNAVLYFVFGYYLFTQPTWGAALEKMSPYFYLIGLSVTILGTYYFNYSTIVSGEFQSYWYSRQSPGIIFMSFFMFVFFKYSFHKMKINLIGRLCVHISRMSFGIYLIHILWIEILSRGLLGVKLSVEFAHPVISVPVLTTIVLALSLLSIRTLRVLPLGELIAPA